MGGLWIEACPGAGMKGRQVAERGQQKPVQPPVQVREAQWPQAGVRTSAGTHRGRQRDGGTDRITEIQRWRWRYSKRQTHRDSEMVMDTETEGERQEKGRLRNKEEQQRGKDRDGDG